jgi:hypothetical protein
VINGSVSLFLWSASHQRRGGHNDKWQRSKTHFDFANDFPRGSQFFQRLSGGDGEDQNEHVSLGNVEPLHGRKLMRSRRIGNLQRAHILVARYDLCWRHKNRTQDTGYHSLACDGQNALCVVRMQCLTCRILCKPNYNAGKKSDEKAFRPATQSTTKGRLTSHGLSACLILSGCHH